MSEENEVPRKFRKKPTIIEAIQLTPELFWFCYKQDWCGPLPEPFNSLSFNGSYNPIYKTISSVWVPIITLKGTMRGDMGDWIIKDVKGEFYSCKPDIFEMTYEEVL